MEKEENRCLINKKDFEDQYTIFFSVQFWTSLSILTTFSYSCEIRVLLEHSNIGGKQAKEGHESKIKKGSSKGERDSSGYNGITCRY